MGQVAAPLGARHGGLPLEDWKPADSLAVAKLYAWGLSGTLEVSLVLSDLIEELGGFEARRFFPHDRGFTRTGRPQVTAGLSRTGRPQVTAGLSRTGRPQVTAGLSRTGRPQVTAGLSRTGRPQVTAGLSRGVAPDPLRRTAGLEGRGIGSSAWVLGASYSSSGRPLLVADSHLAPTVPPYFHLDHVRGGKLDVAGATLPGVPAFWTGRNRNVAWASTAARVVTTDLYVETLHPSDSSLYHDGRDWQRLGQRHETIRVRGGDDVRFTVLSTERGPLLNDLPEAGSVPLSLSWVGTRVLEARSIASLLAVARSDSADALRTALADHHEPTLAMVYADTWGAAGLQVAGWIPQRELPAGLVPLPGRAPWYDWKGRVPFEELPHQPLASDGWVIAADNDLVGSVDSEPVEWLWRTGERARRIDELLRELVSEGPVGLRRIASLQADVEATRARALVASSIALVADVNEMSREAREVAGLMRVWDGRATSESVGSAAYHVFLECLAVELFARRLGEDLTRRYLALPQVDPCLPGLRSGERRGARTSASDTWASREQVSEAIRASLREAWRRLSHRLGRDRSRWQWGRLHPLQFRRFGPGNGSTGLLAGLAPIAYGGSSGTVKAAEYDLVDPFQVRVASTVRFAVDALDLDEMLVSIAPGQSEHPRHPHFRDGLAPWLAGESELLTTSPLLVEESSVARLVLEPRS